MRISEVMRDERGFTLQETVVVMIVSSLLVGFSFTLFGFVMHFLHTNLEIREHHETVQHISAEICRDIERSRHAQLSDSSLVLDRAGSGSVRYGRAQGKIVRNGVVITPPDSSHWTVSWRESGDSTGANMRPIAIWVIAHWKQGSDSVLGTSRIPWSSQGAFASGIERKKQ
jgi:hypothetical protein